MSVFTLGAAALALVTGAQAGDSKVYQLTDSYDSSNWFDKWTFFSNPDPTNGFVSYKTEKDAKSTGLISIQDGEVYIGVDSTTNLTATGDSSGRASVRIESKATYDKGLFIARFSHLPAAACGSWPAFWTYATPWPNAGEMDIVESWNSDAFNRPALHTGAAAEVGSCSIDGTGMTAKVATPNCDNTVTNDVQVETQGCSAYDSSGVYANPNGGVYAMEWTDEYIKIWNWLHEDVPESCDSDNPNPSTFGTPSFVTASSCEIENLFQPQTLVMNIDFCGGAPESTWANSCAASTGFSTCKAFVAAHPDAFTESYWKVMSIKAYQLGEPSSNSGTSSSISAPATATETNSNSAGTATTATSKPTSTETGSSGNEDDEDCDEDDEGETTTSKTDAATGTAPLPTQFTTSTIYTTSIYTVTSCAPTVTNCPAGSVTTEVIALTTTVCPVTATATSVTSTPETEATTGLITTSTPASMTTSTIYVTSKYTITSCPPTVTNCPVGAVTTAVVVSTTVVPCEQSDETTMSSTSVRTTLAHTVSPSTTVTTATVPAGGGKTTTQPVKGGESTPAVITTIATVVPQPSTSSGGNNFYGNSTLITNAATSPMASGTGVVPGCSGARCSATSTPVVTAGAGKIFVSGILVGVVALAAFIL